MKNNSSNEMITIEMECGQPEGSFQKCLDKKDQFLEELEREEIERIRQAQVIKSAAWAM